MITLLEAFQQIAPLLGDPEVDRARNQAARVLHEQLRKLTWSTPVLQRMHGHERDEVVAVVLLRLVQAGPRGRRTGDPDCDAGVCRFLRTALENSLKDLIRARGCHELVSLDPSAGELEPPAARCDARPDHQLDRRRALAELDRALDDLVQVVLPWLDTHRRRDAACRLREGTEQLLRLYAGTTTVQQLADTPGEPAPDAGHRARYALYQRLHRTTEALLGAADDLQQQGTLSRDRAQALRTLVGELKLRKEPS